MAELPSYLYPVRHTFIDDPAGRLDSLEGFLHERQAFSCPVSRVEEPGSGVEAPPKAASESAHDKSTAAPQASETRSHEAEASDCSTVDTGSVREVPHTPEMEPARPFQMHMSLTGLLSQAASSSSEVLTPETVANVGPSSSFFSSMSGFAAPFSPGAGAYYDSMVMPTFEPHHHEFHSDFHPAPVAQPVPPGPRPHGPPQPPPPEPAPQVPPALLPQVPTHAATQNGSTPQVLKLEDALAPAQTAALASAQQALEETQRNQQLEVQQAAAVAAAQAVTASHEEQVAAANAFASASGLALQDAAHATDLPSAGSTGHRMGQCRPCAFWTTKGCSSGQDCQFCHLCAPGEKKRRQKAKRAFFGALAEMQRCFTGGGEAKGEAK